MQHDDGLDFGDVIGMDPIFASRTLKCVLVSAGGCITGSSLTSRATKIVQSRDIHNNLHSTTDWVRKTLSQFFTNIPVYYKYFFLGVEFDHDIFFLPQNLVWFSVTSDKEFKISCPFPKSLKNLTIRATKLPLIISKNNLFPSSLEKLCIGDPKGKSSVDVFIVYVEKSVEDSNYGNITYMRNCDVIDNEWPYDKYVHISAQGM